MSLHDATLAMQRRANAKERFLRRISRQTSNKVAPAAEGKGTDDADGVRFSYDIHRTIRS